MSSSPSRNPAGEKAAPKAVVARVGLYLRQLEIFRDQGRERVSSRELANALNLRDAQVRKDLAHFGPFGHRGVGYRIDELIPSLRRILGVDRAWALGLVGAGNLGRALLRYRGFREQGFHIAAVFDNHPAIVGQPLEGLEILPTERLDTTIKALGIELGVICVPAEEAQKVANSLVSGGVVGILNFAPASLTVPPHVEVVPVDLGIHLERLAYHVLNIRRGISFAG